MNAWVNLRNIGFVAAVAGAGIGAFCNQKLHAPQTVAHASETKSEKCINPCALWDSNWDFRDPTSLVRAKTNNSIQEEKRYNSDLWKKSSKTNRHIILVRHGEYTLKTQKLTKRGHLQAKYTGQRLHELGIKWDKVIASTMTRAKETAEIIVKEIHFDPKKLKHSSLIREGKPIPPQPPTSPVRPDELERYRDGARIEAGFRRYFYRAHPTEKKDTYTLLICHSNVIRYFVCRALQFPPEAWSRLSINHASITWLSISPSGKVSLRFLGDSGYIPAKYVTNSNLKQPTKTSELDE